ncbi:hypothetical protein BYT27DRAFT_7342761 [Phlegmacium glaucopus]|nr:hypothetical protein BYT27DRAFT_7342761 [Phlegmacium glaucopus]
MNACPSVCLSPSATTHILKGLSSPTTGLPLLPCPFTTRSHDVLFVRIEVEIAYGRPQPSSKLHPKLLLSEMFSTKVEEGESDQCIQNQRRTEPTGHEMKSPTAWASPVSHPAKFANVTEGTKLSGTVESMEESAGKTLDQFGVTVEEIKPSDTELDFTTTDSQEQEPEVVTDFLEQPTSLSIAAPIDLTLSSRGVAIPTPDDVMEDKEVVEVPVTDPTNVTSNPGGMAGPCTRPPGREPGTEPWDTTDDCLWSYEAAPTSSRVFGNASLSARILFEAKDHLFILAVLIVGGIDAELTSSFLFPQGTSHVPYTNNPSVPDSGYASAEEDEVETECFSVGSESSFYEDNESDTESDLLRATLSSILSPSNERSSILDQAITLLSTFTNGDEGTEVALTRTFSFPLTTTSSTLKKKNEIQVELNDTPLLKEGHTSVGLQSWGSSVLLAERICLQPSLFSLTLPIDTDGRPLRILELGAGTGMHSIVAAKILQSCNPAPQIIATDYHPEVLDNLAKNVATNLLLLSPSGVWTGKPHIIASLWIDSADVIYHPEHARWIGQCVEKLLSRPSSSSNCGGGGVFWLIIPVRSTGRHERLDRTVDSLFPTYPLERVEARKDSESQLAILEKEEVGSVGRVNEGGYKLFKIGWIN